MNRKFKIILKKIKINFEFFLSIFYRLIIGVEDKSILCESFFGKQYSDSPRAISEYIHKEHPDYKIYWLLNSNYVDKYNVIPNYVKIIKNSGLNRIKSISTKSIFITNENIEFKYFKSRKQHIIQTWHGDRGFKKILYDAAENGIRDIDITDNKYTDFCVAGSTYGEKVYRSAFKYNGEVLNVGMPRNDFLINCDLNYKKLIREKLDLGNKNVLLYAPTFRDGANNQSVTVDLDKILKELNRNSNDWICLLRWHPSIKNSFNESPNVINVSDYPDMTDLLLVTDLLLTDYSSSACDLSLTDKPIILCTFDYDDYIKNCRSLNADPKQVGFLVANSNDELIDYVKKIDSIDFKKYNNIVNKYYDVKETGDSTKIICNKIAGWLGEENENKKSNY